MKDDLKVTLVQTDIVWESSGANRANLEEKLWQHNTATDIIILPEMFTTGFTMNAVAVAEPLNLTTMKWMKQMAAQFQSVVMGSYIVKESGSFFNRLLVVFPEGNIQWYDKRHLFTMAGEDDVFTAGLQRLIFKYKGWNICPLVCYDLRFPVWSRNVNLEYDVLIYIANWPSVRKQAWNTLLHARAIENLSYTIGVNRVGQDPLQNSYDGNSTLINFAGNTLYRSEDNEACISTHALAYDTLQNFRTMFPAHSDADKFEIRI